MALALIKRLIDTRAGEWDEMKKIMDRAEEDDRDLDAEEQASTDKATTSIGVLDVRIDELTALETRNDEFDVQRAKYEGQTGGKKGGDDPTQVSIREQFRQVHSGELQHFDIDLRGLTPEYDYLTGRVQVRDLTVAADADIVPLSFVRRLYEHVIENSAIRRTNVTVLTTTSGEALELPKVGAFMTGQLTAEGGAIAENDPSFAKITMDAFKFTNAVQASTELLTDTGVDLEGFIARDLGRAVADDMGTDFIVGDGSSKPNGIVTASTLGVTGAASVSGAFDADDLIDLSYAVLEAYANRGTWMMRRATEGATRKLAGSDNNYLWQPGLQIASPNLLLGQPVVNDPNMVAIALSAKSVIFGDFSGYVIRDVGSVRISRSDDFAFLNDLATWKAVWRSDGDLLDTTGAVKHFIGNAA